MKQKFSQLAVILGLCLAAFIFGLKPGEQPTSVREKEMALSMTVKELPPKPEAHTATIPIEELILEESRLSADNPYHSKTMRRAAASRNELSRKDSRLLYLTSTIKLERTTDSDFVVATELPNPYQELKSSAIELDPYEQEENRLKYLSNAK